MAARTNTTNTTKRPAAKKIAKRRAGGATSTG
jgi:hypothetical protein